MGEGTRRASVARRVHRAVSLIACATSTRARRSAQRRSSATATRRAEATRASRSTTRPRAHDLDDGMNLTRVDLGLRAVDSQGIVNAMVPGFDDARDYFVALRTYDARGTSRANSNVGVIQPARAGPGAPVQESFESTAAGAHPDGLDRLGAGTNRRERERLSSRSSSSPTAARALGAPGATGRDPVARRRVGRDELVVLRGARPHRERHARGLGRSERALALPRRELPVPARAHRRGAYALSKRGSGALTCAGSASTGVAPVGRTGSASASA